MRLCTRTLLYNCIAGWCVFYGSTLRPAAIVCTHQSHCDASPTSWARFVIDLSAYSWNTYTCIHVHMYVHMYCYCYHCSLFLLLFCLRLRLLLLSTSVVCCNSLSRIADTLARFRRLSDRLGCAACCLLLAVGSDYLDKVHLW